MKHFSVFFCCILVTFLLSITSCTKRSGDPKVLVFSKTAGFHHASIPDGISAIQKLGSEHGFKVDTTTNAAMFREDTLEQYSTVVFLNTTGDVLNHYQEADFERYIKAGGGYVGIHAAADTEHHWGWYGRLVGGYFIDHPGINDPHPNVQEGSLNVEEANHSSTEFLPTQWHRTDEWYSYKYSNENTNVLLTVDEDSYKGGKNTGYHPMAWYHEYEGGRAFYTGLGHTKEAYTEQEYLNHILAGIQYTIGENDKLDYSDVEAERVPDSRRFTKNSLLKGGLFEPTEMTILPNKDVLIAQRRGEILLYKDQDSTLSQAGTLDVYWQTDEPDVNAEEGVMGIKADPEFKDNQQVYVYYSPADTSVNRLSRFTFSNDKLDVTSETIVLEFYSKRDICCHTGGSIAFDQDGLLYLSTGDNSTPFNQPDQPYVLDGYAPLDERPGFEQFDARRTAGNSNDLRGKILRFRVKEDGSYEIPDGNLYEGNTEATRPEIYIQGNRNPYRISVDQKNGYLYWGEVGPDANNDSLNTRGPRGYDEINQAREAGFYGWPMFVGNNYAYHRFDYDTGKPGESFDPDNPTNFSPNNTGIEELPPAEPAFIWYPYAASEEFPQVGTGGRNAMAGPVYHTDLYPEETRFPDYYDGKLFIYDWVRGWIKAVTMQPNGDFDKMEPFLEGTKLNAPIDMEIGPDGRLYILEYGSGWFAQNDDSGLNRIDFDDGNLPPVLEGLTVDNNSGTLPLEVIATMEAYDPEQDQLNFIWKSDGDIIQETKAPTFNYVFEEVGEYELSVEVQDTEGNSILSNTVTVYAGNAAPLVSIEINGNNSFYFPDQPVSYSVTIEDPDDPSASEDLSTLFVSADYVAGSDLAEASQGHKIMTEAISGRSMIDSHDCQACHTINSASVGPSYTEVAERYQDSVNANPHLVEKIINGGSGVWGERAMPAHLEMGETEAEKIVAWILSLNDEGPTKESLPASGKVAPTLGKKAASSGVLRLSASYTDKGANGVKPLTGNTSVYLHNSSIDLAGADDLQGYSAMTYEGQALLLVPQDSGSFKIGQVDLTDVSAVEILTVTQEVVKGDYIFELHLDSPDGQKVGETVRKGGGEPTSEGLQIKSVQIPMETEANTVGTHDLYFKSKSASENGMGQLILSEVTFKNEKS